MDFSADPYWDNVSVLLQFDSGQRNLGWIANLAAGWSSVFRTGTVTNNPVSTSIYKWGDGSFYNNGTSTYKIYDATIGAAGTDFGTGDFTLEFWVYLNANQLVDWAQLMGSLAQGTAGGFMVFMNTKAMVPSPIYFSDSQTSTWLNTGNVSQNVWHHIAVTRASGVSRMFLDGVQVATHAVVYNFTASKLAVGSAVNSVSPFKGYIDDIRITKGVARYTADFAVPTKAFPRGPVSVDTTSYDEHYESVVSLLHLDGPAGVPTANSIRDETGRAWTPNGVVSLDTAQYRFGISSLSGVGSSDRWISTPHKSDLSVATGDFTIECWFRLNELGRIQTFSNKRDGSGAEEHSLYVTASNTIAAALFDSTPVFNGAGTTTVTTGVWYHVALCRSGNTCYLFLDGVLQYSADQSAPPAGNTAPLYIGKDGFVNYTRDLNGWIDEYRFTRVCRYTADFAPPTAAFKNRPLITDYTPVVNTYDPDPYFASVTVLAHANNVNATDNQFVNETGLGNFVEELGIPFIASGKGKFGHGAYCFDGYSIAKYKDTGTVGLGAFGTGDFTIELWAKLINNGVVPGTAWPRLLATSDYQASPAGWYISINASVPNFRFERSPASTFFNFPTVANNTWYHIAISRVSGIDYFFLDGTLVGTQADTTNYTNLGFAVGGHITGSMNDYEKFRGYLDEIRITNGVGRYTASFTPPTNPSKLSYIVTEAFSAELALAWDMRAYLETSWAVEWDMTSDFVVSQEFAWGFSNPFTVMRCISWSVSMPLASLGNPMPLSKVQSSSALTNTDHRISIDHQEQTCG